MLTYRKAYFSLIKENNKYLNETVISEILINVGKFSSKSDLFLNFDSQIDENKLENIANRIRVGEPYQYVLGYCYFLGNKIFTRKNTLIPRQETEQLVIDTTKYIKEVFGDTTIKLVDLCCGSGVIGISLYLNDKNIIPCFSDISADALELTTDNAKMYDIHCQVSKSDLLERFPYKEKFDVIVANPPYIKNESTVDEQVLKYEPHLALFAQPQTLFYEKIFEYSKTVLNKKFVLAFEIDEDMISDLKTLINTYFANDFYEFKRDMYGKFRFLYIIRKEYE